MKSILLFAVIFSRRRSNGSPIGTNVATVAARDLPILFSFDLAHAGVDPHARALPRPACLPGKHDGLASYFPGDPPALIHPDSASAPRVNLRSPSARLFNRRLPDSATGFNRLDWNPD
ncbi:MULTISPECIES: hypothetical protein [Burkholderia]|uniref:hypothetical protein n=1 Tax=Burkholderia TaxID=32008 RepID=UPI0015824852|nr:MULTISPECIES: hypothetical protein [Burkholderia]